MAKVTILITRPGAWYDYTRWFSHISLAVSPSSKKKGILHYDTAFNPIRRVVYNSPYYIAIDMPRETDPGYEALLDPDDADEMLGKTSDPALSGAVTSTPFEKLKTTLAQTAGLDFLAGQGVDWPAFKEEEERDKQASWWHSWVKGLQQSNREQEQDSEVAKTPELDEVYEETSLPATPPPEREPVIRLEDLDQAIAQANSALQKFPPRTQSPSEEEAHTQEPQDEHQTETAPHRRKPTMTFGEFHQHTAQMNAASYKPDQKATPIPVSEEPAGDSEAKEANTPPEEPLSWWQRFCRWVGAEHVMTDDKTVYNLFTRNCSHNTEVALSALYPEDFTPRDSFGLLPSTTAIRAIDLSLKLHERHFKQTLRFRYNHPSRQISRSIELIHYQLILKRNRNTLKYNRVFRFFANYRLNKQVKVMTDLGSLHENPYLQFQKLQQLHASNSQPRSLQKQLGQLLGSVDERYKDFFNHLSALKNIVTKGKSDKNKKLVTRLVKLFNAFRHLSFSKKDSRDFYWIFSELSSLLQVPTYRDLINKHQLLPSIQFLHQTLVDQAAQLRDSEYRGSIGREELKKQLEDTQQILSKYSTTTAIHMALATAPASREHHHKQTGHASRTLWTRTRKRRLTTERQRTHSRDAVPAI